MSSPFFWWHFTILLLIAGNCVWSAICAHKAVMSFQPSALVSSVVLRAASLAYVVSSLGLLLLAMVLFAQLELTSAARQCWSRNQAWRTIRAGMSRRQVVDLVGEPVLTGFAYSYQLHPLAYESGSILFDTQVLTGTSSDDAAVVKDKRPDPSVAWLPPVNALGRQAALWIGILAFAGCLILSAANLVPWSLAARWNAWPLYIPMLALLFGWLIVKFDGAGWGHHWMFLIPGLVLIALAWPIRIWIVIRASG